jgi:aminoglycoside phosphotransferase (APT) family kinase protein
MTDVRKGHEINIRHLERYMNKHVHGFKTKANSDGIIVEIKQFKSGQSNPTYYIKGSNDKEYVLRKKPFGQLLQSAHMVRN